MTFTNDQNRFLKEWMNFLKIPSVSADLPTKKMLILAADWVKSALSQAGCPNTEIIKTPGHPIVYGEYLINPSFLLF